MGTQTERNPPGVRETCASLSAYFLCIPNPFRCFCLHRVDRDSGCEGGRARAMPCQFLSNLRPGGLRACVWRDPPLADVLEVCDSRTDQTSRLASKISGDLQCSRRDLIGGARGARGNAHRIEVEGAIMPWSRKSMTSRSSPGAQTLRARSAQREGRGSFVTAPDTETFRGEGGGRRSASVRGAETPQVTGFVMPLAERRLNALAALC